MGTPIIDQVKRTLTPVVERLWPLRLGWALAYRNGLFGKLRVGSEPTLDAEALAKWRSVIVTARVYLEYGAGGSTVEAIRSAEHVISVETDDRFLDAVEARVCAISPRGTFHPVPVDIGMTAKWGRPVMMGRTPKRIGMWSRYPAAPWNLIHQLGLEPDFILVDGRFRAAAALESMLRLSDKSKCVIMLDDFRQREREYDIVLRFADDIERVGRAVVFRRKSDFDRDACERALQRACREYN